MQDDSGMGVLKKDPDTETPHIIQSICGLNPFCDPDEHKVLEFLSCDFLLLIIL